MLTRPIGVGLATQAIRKRLLEELDRNATPARAVVGELVAGEAGHLEVGPGAGERS